MASKLLPGQSAPIGIITSTDRSAVVLIATAIALVIGIVSLGIRAYVRFIHLYALDDYTIFVAGLFSVFQSITVFVAAGNGLGKALQHINPPQLLRLQKASYASNILFVVTLWLTKCSVVFLYLRLSPNRRHKLVSTIILVGITVLSVISIFFVALSCNLSHPWITIQPKCTDLYTRWQVFAAFDIFTEVVLIALAFYIVYGLQMSWVRKGSVLIAFGLRLLVIVAIAFRLHYLAVENDSSDPTYNGLFASIWTQVEIAYAILAATIPCSRSFLAATSTQVPIQDKRTRNTKYANGSEERSLPNNITLTSLSERKKDAKTPKVGGSFPSLSNHIYTWPKVDNDSSVISPGDHHSLKSNESRQGIIRREVEWAVNYEEAHSTDES